MPRTISKRCVVVIVLGLGLIPGAFFGLRLGPLFGIAAGLATAVLAFSLIMGLDRLEKSRQAEEA